jgi:hypothetical protein
VVIISLVEAFADRLPHQQQTKDDLAAPRRQETMDFSDFSSHRHPQPPRRDGRGDGQYPLSTPEQPRLAGSDLAMASSSQVNSPALATASLRQPARAEERTFASWFDSGREGGGEGYYDNDDDDDEGADENGVYGERMHEDTPRSRRDRWDDDYGEPGAGREEDDMEGQEGRYGDDRGEGGTNETAEASEAGEAGENNGTPEENGGTPEESRGNPEDNEDDGEDDTPKQQPVRKRGRPKGWRPGMTYRQMRGLSPLPPSEARPRPARSHRPVGRPRLSNSGHHTHHHQNHAATSDGSGPDGGDGPRRRGRPRLAAVPRLAALRRRVYDAQRPVFLEFVCEWRGCQARLHNADTLDRHVRLVHGERANGRECLWMGCGWRAPEEEYVAPSLWPSDGARAHGAAHGAQNGHAWGQQQQQQPPHAQPSKPQPAPQIPIADPPAFATLDALLVHVDFFHLSRVRRIMGDGPVVPPMGTTLPPPDISRFLRDRRGRELAPLLGDLEDHIEDETTRRARKAALKRILAQRDENAPEEFDGGEGGVGGGDAADRLAVEFGGGMELG